MICHSCGCKTNSESDIVCTICRITRRKLDHPSHFQCIRGSLQDIQRRRKEKKVKKEKKKGDLKKPPP